MARASAAILVLALVPAVTFGAAAGAQTALGAEIVLEVSPVPSAKGRLHLAIYDRAEEFPKQGFGRVRDNVPAEASITRYVALDLPPGRYAVAVFHDENGNGAFDQGLFAWPLEGFGFSRDPSVLSGAPDFDAAAVEVDEPGVRIPIRLRQGPFD